MTDLWTRLKQRKLVQWSVAYIAAAFALLQGVDIIAQRFAWPDSIARALIIASVIGFFVVLLLAWYHGERGAQKVSGTELLILTVLFAIGGFLIWNYGSNDTVPLSEGSRTNAEATAGGDGPATHADAISKKSIAVLPLTNQSGDKDQQYFSDGLSEDLIIALSQFGGLKVIGRNSSFRFRDSEQSSGEIGRLLGVAHLLEGSVQRVGDQVRIRAELVNTADGSTLWSEQYDRSYQDLFALQDEITHSVADALKAKLLDGSGVVTQDDHPPGGSLAAYNAFLQGQFHSQRQTESDVRSGITFYQQAIKLDANYAAAYAGLALAELKLVNYYLNELADRQQMIEAARAAADKALSLQPGLAAAHLARADVLWFSNYDWQGQRAALQRAVDLAPGDSQARFWLGRSYVISGEVGRGVELMAQGLVTDPLCAECHYIYSLYLPALGRDQESVAEANKALQLAPDNNFARSWLVLMDAMHGRLASALSKARQMPESSERDLALAFALAPGDDRAAADAALATAIESQYGVGAYQIAQVQALRGDTDQMFAWLDRAYANQDPGLSLLLSDVGLLKYSGDPRFAAFCRKVGLPVPAANGKVPKVADVGGGHE